MKMMMGVFCNKCWNEHQYSIDCAMISNTTNRTESTCPHCGEKLVVAYEIQTKVINVQSKRK